MARSLIRRSEIISALLDLVSSRVTPSAWDWFARQFKACCLRAFDRASFLGAFAGAARQLGKTPVRPIAAESERLASVGLSWPLDSWTVDEMARALLLVRAADNLPEAGADALVEDCYRAGDARERQAVLRALALLPRPERLIALGVDGCRSQSQPVFEAIACENPFPAWHFGAADFNEMVLRTLGAGIPLRRIVALDRRTTPELLRMAERYAEERLGAGRAVPPDLGWLLAREATQ